MARSKKEDILIMDKRQVHYIDAIKKDEGIQIILPILEEFNLDIIKIQVSLLYGILIQREIDITPSL